MCFEARLPVESAATPESEDVIDGDQFLVRSDPVSSKYLLTAQTGRL